VATLVIRLSSLGDVILAGAVTGSLAPVTFLTAPRWAEVAAALPGVDQVLRFGEDPVPRHWDRIIDLHASARSRRICLGLTGPVSRVRRHDLRRRVRVWFKLSEPPPPVVERYASAAGVVAQPTPWLVAEGARDALIMCPGAAWATKRWPAERWIGLGNRWQGPILALGGPGEAALLHHITDTIGPRAIAIAETGFEACLACLGRGRVAVGGDTGLLHLCAAAGMPTVALFGPTSADDGFWPHVTAALQAELSCRPCSRHGRRSCPVGDHRCMTALEPASVHSVVEQLCAG
jgi:heptosyltransferase-2